MDLALKYYCRTRFISNLLPLLKKATSLSRVVSVAAGTKEGPVDRSDLSAAKNLGMLARRAHFTTFITLSHTILAEKAPEVSFVHDYPGAVKSGIFRGSTGVTMLLVRAALKVIGPFVYIPSEESGQRHVYLSTSAAFPAAAESKNTGTALGLPLAANGHVARGIDGNKGSGVYSVDQNCESAGQAVEELLANLKNDGVRDEIWDHTQKVFDGITEAGKV